MVLRTSSLLLAALPFAALGSAGGCHLVVHADKYHVVEQGGEGGTGAGGNGAGGAASTGGGGANACAGVLGCDGCTQCAKNDPCASEWQNCQADGACVNFANCLSNCGGTIDCWNGCLGPPSTGALQEAWTTCAVCKTCRNQCGVAVSCP